MQYRVAVATLRGRPYYEIIRALKQMEVKYDSIAPADAARSEAKVVITTQDEAGLITGRKAVMLDTELAKYPAVAKAKILKTVAGAAADDSLTVGIDPGDRIGISILYLHEEIASIVGFLASEAASYISGQIVSVNGAMA